MVGRFLVKNWWGAGSFAPGDCRNCVCGTDLGSEDIGMEAKVR